MIEEAVDTLHASTRAFVEDLPPAFWDNVDKGYSPGGCWEWTGNKDRDGYGRLSTPRGVTGRAARLSLMARYGVFDPALVTDHLCRNPPCVNPDHLEAVPNAVNVMRGVGFGATNASKTHCVNGHELPPYSPGGRRPCRECSAEANRRFKRLNRDRLNAMRRIERTGSAEYKPHHNASKTHCPKGHPLDGKNKDGSRNCKTCHRECEQRRRDRIKAGE